MDQGFGVDEVKNKENIGFFLVGTKQCLYEALLFLADDGVDVDNCIICRVYDLPINSHQLPIMANA